MGRGPEVRRVPAQDHATASEVRWGMGWRRRKREEGESGSRGKREGWGGVEDERT